MRKYIKTFKSHTQYETFINGGGNTPFVKPNVSHCIAENEVHYNPRTWADEYLTFVALENTTFTFTPTSGNAISYSIDNGDNWTVGNSVEITKDNKVLWRGEMTPITENGVGKFSSTGRFNVQGNIMSLLFGDEFKGKTGLTGKDSAFCTLFDSNSNLVNAKNLSLPATTLAECCYDTMFNGCTSLTTAPELPAKTLANSCYQYMFQGCTGLTTAPKLPATTLASYCYSGMFYGCRSLTTAPELPAKTLADYCYNGMFIGCTGLKTAPKLPATTLAGSCYQSMFEGCTGLTTAPKLPATTLADTCYISMFSGCTGLTTAPEFPATILLSNCYQSMFNGCTNLNYIKCLATNISASDCLKNWVSGVASSGTFVKAASMNDWTTGTSGIPSGWTVVTE